MIALSVFEEKKIDETGFELVYPVQYLHSLSSVPFLSDSKSKKTFIN